MTATLLIAESDRDLANVYRQRFVENGYHVFIASDGPECMAIIRRESPAVLVAALEIPWSPGCNLMTCLREESRRRSVPSLILTGFTPHDRIADWTDPFLVEYFRKPVALADLLACVHIAQSRLRDWRICRVGQTFESFSTADGI